MPPADIPIRFAPHTLNFDATQHPDVFAALMALVTGLDDVSDETLAIIVKEVKTVRPHFWRALQHARTVVREQGYRA